MEVVGRSRGWAVRGLTYLIGLLLPGEGAFTRLLLKLRIHNHHEVRIESFGRMCTNAYSMVQLEPQPLCRQNVIESHL